MTMTTILEWLHAHRLPIIIIVSICVAAICAIAFIRWRRRKREQAQAKRVEAQAKPDIYEARRGALFAELKGRADLKEKEYEWDKTADEEFFFKNPTKYFKDGTKDEEYIRRHNRYYNHMGNLMYTKTGVKVAVYPNGDVLSLAGDKLATVDKDVLMLPDALRNAKVAEALHGNILENKIGAIVYEGVD